MLTHVIYYLRMLLRYYRERGSIMDKLNFSGDFYEKLIDDDDTFIAIVVTGIVYWILPEITWTNDTAFFGGLFIYMAVFSCTHFALNKIKEHRSKKYTTIKLERERRDVS